MYELKNERAYHVRVHFIFMKWINHFTTLPKNGIIELCLKVSKYGLYKEHGKENEKYEFIAHYSP